MVLAEGDKPRSLAYLAVKAVICHITTVPCMSRQSSSGTEEDLFHGLFLLLLTEEVPSLLDILAHAISWHLATCCSHCGRLGHAWLQHHAPQLQAWLKLHMSYTTTTQTACGMVPTDFRREWIPEVACSNAGTPLLVLAVQN